MFIQTESTPNPETMKFLPGQDVLGQTGPMDFSDAEAAAISPLAKRLFALDMVERVFLGSDFISVTKSGGEWSHVKPTILGAIMEHFISEDPILLDADQAVADNAPSLDEYEGDEAEIVSQIVDLLDTRVRPAVAQDGGDITFHKYESGVVFLEMRGSCAGCPSSTMTLQSGIENLLKHYVPEVQRVEPVEF